MNVYIYGGLSRFEAKTSIIRNNEQPELNKEYSIEYTKGMLVVAYPEQQVDPDVDLPTALTFEYWIHPFSEEELADDDEQLQPDEPDDANNETQSQVEPESN